MNYDVHEARPSKKVVIQGFKMNEYMCSIKDDFDILYIANTLVMFHFMV